MGKKAFGSSASGISGKYCEIMPTHRILIGLVLASKHSRLDPKTRVKVEEASHCCLPREKAQPNRFFVVQVEVVHSLFLCSS
jgi:hypothetical protein